MMKLFVTGNLGNAAEIKTLPDGSTVLEFSVASNDRQKKAGQYVDHTTWVRCSMYGSRGEKLAQHLEKGARVAVTGTQSVREYESNGQRRYSVELRVDDIDLMGGKRDAETARATGGSAPRQRLAADEDVPF